MRVLLIAGFLAYSLGCGGGKHHADVDGVLVPQARSGFDVPEGPVLHIPGDDLATLPDDEVIKIAAYRKTPWKDVRELIKRIEAEGKTAVPLVGDRTQVRAFRLSDEVEGPTIAVTATAEGKVCVAAPGVPEAKCAQTITKNQVDRAHTRRLVREAVQVLKLYEADLEVQGAITWADVVRAVDGTRTCCQDTPVAVDFQM